MKWETYSIDFWKQRIKEAEGRDLNFIYYQVETPRWEEIEKVHKEIIEKEKVEGKILDAGCGHGRISKWFDDYTGVDFSPDLIELGKRENPDKRFIQADLKKLPFKDKEFDWAICVSMRRMVIRDSGQEEWDKMEKELKRVSKKILILDYSSPREYTIL